MITKSIAFLVNRIKPLSGVKSFGLCPTQIRNDRQDHRAVNNVSSYRHFSAGEVMLNML